MSIELVNGNFDIKSFNTNFSNYIQQQKELRIQQEADKLNQSKITNDADTQYKKLTLHNIIIEWRDTFIGLLDDIMRLDFRTNVIFRNNRLFFLGMTLITSVILYYIIYSIFHNVELFTESNKITHFKNEHLFNISFNFPEKQQILFHKLMDKLLNSAKPV